MYGVRTIAISSGLELCGYVDCSLDYLMPTYDQVKDYVDQFNKIKAKDPSVRFVLYFKYGADGSSSHSQYQFRGQSIHLTLFFSPKLG